MILRRILVLFLKLSESSGGSGYVSTTDPSVPGAYQGTAAQQQAGKTNVPTGSSSYSSGGGGSSVGGGGGGASVGGASPTLTPPEVTSLEVVGGDTPASYSGGTISAYVPPTIKDIPSYVRTNIKDDFSGTVAGAAKIAYGSAKRGFQRLTAKEKRDFKTQQKFDTKVKELERGTLQVTAADKAAAFQGYQGTAITELSRVPDKTLIRDGSLGDLPSAQALQNRYQTEIENKKLT